MTEKYSVLMSVYYKEKPEYLKMAVQSMLDQTIKPSEFILIKDGPLTEDLESVISDFISSNPGLFKIIANETNLGLGPSLAKGVEAATNDLIARMDSDDYVVPDRCEKQLKMFKEDADLEIVGTHEVEFIDEIDNIVSIHKVPQMNDKILQFMRRRCAILHPTVIYKKDSVLRCGNYHDVPLYEDYDLFARMIFEFNAKCYNVPENLYYIRTSEDFFVRRGGVQYAKTVLRFKWNQYKKSHMSFVDFCVSGLGQALVCVLPNEWRKKFYVKFLRK